MTKVAVDIGREDTKIPYSYTLSLLQYGDRRTTNVLQKKMTKNILESINLRIWVSYLHQKTPRNA